MIAVVSALPPAAHAQTKPKPERKGHKLSVKIDSQPQGAAIYVDDRAYGIEGYTPSTIKLPKGTYTIILELQGYKPVERPLDIQRSQVFVFTLEKQAQPAVFDVRPSSDQSAMGATISVDGSPVGTVPNRIQVAAGSHLVEISKQGFQPYRDTLQVGEGENRTVVVALAAAQKPGSILVTADVAGADVYVDGTRKDTAPALIGDLPEGTHMIEVRKEGLNPWKQAVTIVGGQQLKVQATLQPAAPTVGSLKVLSGTAGATVRVDGDDKGPANQEIANVRPGSHIVQVAAPGFEPKNVEVQVVPNELRVVQVDLAPQQAQRQTGGVHVISQVPDAEVFIDGASVGKAPIDRNDLSVGHHFIVIHRDGYADQQQEIDVQPGKTIEVAAKMAAAGSIRAVTNVPADVFVDGSPAGKTPTTVNNVSVGQHVVEYKAPGYLDTRINVMVNGGQEQLAQADLPPLQTGPTPMDLVRNQMGQSSFGAAVLDRFKFNADIGFGYAEYIFARVTTGVFKMGQHFGGDVGIQLQSTLYEWDVGIRPRVQFYRADPIAIGMDLAIMGGGGPTKRNAFEFEAGVMATLLAGSRVRITFRPYLQVWSDRLCPSVSDIKDDDTQTGTPVGMPVPGSGSIYKNDEADVCKSFDAKRDMMNASGYQLPMRTITGVTPFGQNDPRERFTGVRFMLQGVLEIAINQTLSVWALIEGAPAQEQRWSYTSQFYKGFAPFYQTDFPFYGRAGATFKF